MGGRDYYDEFEENHEDEETKKMNDDDEYDNIQRLLQDLTSYLQKQGQNIISLSIAADFSESFIFRTLPRGVWKS